MFALAAIVCLTPLPIYPPDGSVVRANVPGSGFEECYYSTKRGMSPLGQPMIGTTWIPPAGSSYNRRLDWETPADLGKRFKVVFWAKE